MNTQVKQHQPNLRKQAGGTFLGLILGLIVGLGIAVVVALMITKSPIPFVNKVTKQERTELSPGQAADPNKPLYGNKDVAKEAPPAPKDPDQKPAPDAKKPDTPAAPPKTADVPKDKDKLAAITKDQPAKSENAADDKWTYFLQTGAFREQADAENARAKLALLGFEAKVSERPSDNGTLYRVRIGPIGQSETVNRMRSKLSDSGIDAAIVRIPK
ncbi:cell division protein [Herbaspirillum sp. CF444]|uniref:SPOR domain-containing protein n=1 Tax=Herbaspirillum sp. CF444 TaxID=1144319 RepID=UPI0002723A8B|nr:SPOR domain-containing protein [Herbaspirillum sp. CF444]EJL83468.1 cell division protein [Herbaspirillum sp. CF444]